MDYADAVQTAPGGWRHFGFEDLYRLPASAARHALSTVPNDEIRRAESGDVGARERLRRALFWTFVYHLEPACWDQLAQAEPIDPGVLEALPRKAKSVADIGAGTGRLTAFLVTRYPRVIAVEPALAMAKLLRANVPSAMTLSAWADALPIASGWSELTVACGAFGPDPAILAELERVTSSGGVIALISPERPEVFEAMGWDRVSKEPPPAPAHEEWIDEFFGAPDPPHELVLKRCGASRRNQARGTVS